MPERPTPIKLNAIGRMGPDGLALVAGGSTFQASRLKNDGQAGLDAPCLCRSGELNSIQEPNV